MAPKCACGRQADYYSMDPAPNGWGHYVCRVCANPQWINEPCCGSAFQ